MEKLLLDPHIQKFIHENADKDTSKLMLQAKKYPDWPFSLMMEQIKARQKAKEKLPEFYAHPGLIFPNSLSMEQCSSEETAIYKAGLIQKGPLADLTGGFGIDTYYLSKKAGSAYHLERQAELSELAAHNFTLLKANITSICAEGIQWLGTQKENFQTIYLDPARRDEQNRKMVSLADCEPNVLEHLRLLLQKGRELWIKTSPLLDIQQSLQQLACVKCIHVIAVQNECKEVLYCCTAETTEQIQLFAVNLLKAGKQQTFSFTFEEEKNSQNSLSFPKNYLYEPNSAILKAGAFKSLGQQLGLQKLHTHSHLYTASELVPDFPGRIFLLKGILKVDAKTVARLFPDKKAMLLLRNFPLSTEALLAKLKLKQGGTEYLLATTLKDEKHVLLHAERLT